MRVTEAMTFAMVIACISGCGNTMPSSMDDGVIESDASMTDGNSVDCGTAIDCATTNEQRASDEFDSLLGDETALENFLKRMPKGGDLHNHLSGAVYAETYLEWARDDGNCINTTTVSAVSANQCNGSTQPAPSSGVFYEQVLRAWSMLDFMPGATSGHDHFFSTFGKFGLIAGQHRDDSIADLAIRAADENQLYIETMFNTGNNVGDLAATTWQMPVTVNTLSSFYDAVVGAPMFATELASDVLAITQAAATYKTILGCSGGSPPPACDVDVRFIAQVSRTGALDRVFGQLIAAFEIAKMTPALVGANLSSPEDNTTSLNNYDLHMAMLDFLYNKYTVPATSPLRITLHAGELTPEFLPPAHSTANTFHIRAAVETAHAERIGHGLDVLSETNSSELLDQMHTRNVLVEICLSSNIQILNVSGAAHPLDAYLSHGVPVALATDDQGVSRSSLAGEAVRAARDQGLTYRQLKQLARNSLEHAFVPGASLWTSIVDAQPVEACAATATAALGDSPSTQCQAFLDGSQRATLEWKLEKNFLAFERER